MVRFQARLNSLPKYLEPKFNNIIVIPEKYLLEFKLWNIYSIPVGAAANSINL